MYRVWLNQYDAVVCCTTQLGRPVGHCKMLGTGYDNVTVNTTRVTTYMESSNEERDNNVHHLYIVT